jgi:hypothetical protein
MHNRRKFRLGLKVIHRHRVGNQEFRRVSELVFVRGQPKAVLGWIDVGGVRTPIYICDLDPEKLRKTGTGKTPIYSYDGVTVDPRYEDFTPEEPREYRGPERRRHKTPYVGMERRRSA